MGKKLKGTVSVKGNENEQNYIGSNSHSHDTKLRGTKWDSFITTELSFKHGYNMPFSLSNDFRECTYRHRTVTAPSKDSRVTPWAVYARSSP